MFPEQKIISLTFGLISTLLMAEVQALDVFPATLNLDIESSYCDTDTPLRLCIGGDFNCYDISDTCRNASGCYDSNTCIVTTHTLTGINPQIDDHPFVDHPDDWDYVYIRNDSESGFFLKHLKLTLTNLLRARNVFDLTTGANVSIRGSGDYVFADWSASGAGRWFQKDNVVPIYDWVKKQREEHVKAVFCGTDARCLEQEFKDLRLSWAVREQTYDVGQAGIVKYRPWDSGDQHGCDEAFNYYSSQFTNNIHYSCDSDGNNCSYFKWWKTDSNYMDFKREQMARAGRLYRLDFNENSIPCGTGHTTVRTGINGAELCTNATCTTVNGSVRYTPKAGDLFLRIGLASGTITSWHAMTLLGEYWFLPAGANNTDMVVVPVIHKRGDIVRAEVSTGQGDANQKTGTACNDPYEFNYYVGEVDHEIDPDGNGPLTSGGRPSENGPNYGFRISLIPLY